MSKKNKDPKSAKTKNEKSLKINGDLEDVLKASVVKGQKKPKSK